MADTCDFTMSGLRERLPKAFAKVTANTCGKVIAKVRQKENDYWNDDTVLDATFAIDSQEEASISSHEDVS